MSHLTTSCGHQNHADQVVGDVIVEIERNGGFDIVIDCKGFDFLDNKEININQ